MKLILVFSLLMLSFTSNGQDLSVYNCLKSETFEYAENAKLEPVKRDLKIKYVDTGNAIVFRMIRFYDCPDIWDEQIFINLKWMVPKDSTSFLINVTEADSLKMPLYYDTRGPGPIPGNTQFFQTAKGFIKGIKQGNDWMVQTDIEIVYLSYYSKLIERRRFNESHLYQKWKSGKRKKKSLLSEF